MRRAQRKNTCAGTSTPTVSILARRMRRAQHREIFRAIGELIVSILARRMRRAQPPVSAWRWCRFTGFNPRPTHAPGATFMRSKATRFDDVSILARRMRRAQQRTAPGRMVSVTFQSSPDACAGRNPDNGEARSPLTVFQSSPDACAGRNSRGPTVIRSGSRFNPRPTHAPGATISLPRWRR